MAPPAAPPASIRAAKALGRVLIASVFLIAGAQKLQEVAASLSSATAPANAGKGAAVPATPATASTTATLAYASRRLDLFLASLGAPSSVLAALRPHHAILVALVGLAEVAAGGGLVLARPWAPPALLALLVLVTPVAHCFWLLAGSASAGLELGHFNKNAAIAGALVLEWVAGAEAAAAGAGRGGAAVAARGGGKATAVAVVAATGGAGRDPQEDPDGAAVGKDE